MGGGDDGGADDGGVTMGCVTMECETWGEMGVCHMGTLIWGGGGVSSLTML